MTLVSHLEDKLPKAFQIHLPQKELLHTLLLYAINLSELIDLQNFSPLKKSESID